MNVISKLNNYGSHQMKFKLKFVLALIFFTMSSVYAQKQIGTQHHVWMAYSGVHKVAGNWAVHSEYQLRRNEFFNFRQQALVRMGIVYETKHKIQITAGYAWVKTYPYGIQPVLHANQEHRIWQQVSFNQTFEKWQIQHRYRTEQRFLEQWQADSIGQFSQEGFNFRQRIRYRLLLNIPLSKKGIADHSPFLSVSDEVFLGFGEGIGKNVLDQNRLSFALGWRFHKDFNIQLGYLNQYLIKSDGVKIERNHTWQVALFYQLDFRKTQTKKEAGS